MKNEQLISLLEKETCHETQARFLEILEDISGMFNMDVHPDFYSYIGKNNNDARTFTVLQSLAKKQLAKLLLTLAELDSEINN